MGGVPGGRGHLGNCGEMGMHFVSLRLQPLTRIVYFGTCMTYVSC